MRDRAPLSMRVIEAVEARLRRHASPGVLRIAYRAGYMVLKPWWFVTRPETLGVKVVVRCGDEVVLVRHTYARRNSWDIPGGFLSPGEDPAVAVRRELAEELGVHPTALQLIAHVRSRVDRKREVLYAFVADVETKAITPGEAEIAEARWFRRDTLPDRTTGLARRMVARSDWEYWTHGPDG
jgi:ADP-ribose pyrophosphatase YjhB (NUDIX family)